MQITQIPNAAPREDQVALIKLLKKAEFNGGGNQMRIGIRNAARVICTAVETTGMSEFIGVVSKLQEDGFEDELEHSNGMRDGYDAIFSK